MRGVEERDGGSVGLVKNYSEQHRSRRLHTKTRDNSASQTGERGRGPERNSKSSFKRKINTKRAHKSHARSVKHVASDE